MIANQIAGLLTGGVVAAATDYESIATVNVGAGGSASVSFSSIPSTYKHLQLRYISADNRTGSGTGSSNLYWKINGDTGTNYSFHELYGTGASAGAGSAANYAGWITYGGNSSTWGCGVIDFLDYADTNKYKTVRALTGADDNGDGFIELTSANWRNTAAISSLSVTPLTPNFLQYSSFALYGIK
jgi:hypothetical protein